MWPRRVVYESSPGPRVAGSCNRNNIAYGQLWPRGPPKAELSATRGRQNRLKGGMAANSLKHLHCIRVRECFKITYLLRRDSRDHQNGHRIVTELKPSTWEIEANFQNTTALYDSLAPP
jgi:hypothetical protein